ncbi:hypothetical protein GF412_01845 [Candidatus Micrarchaeota archaeon]|nr:hypothetical protein [Candidatus Micrarchaeota archaeon]MBD3417705.1 hypothetical protein [Candidatus Micrarchaeota archaeon]
MSEKNGNPKSGKGSGTLRDDAAPHGRPAGSRSWGSIIKKSTVAAPSSSEDSSGDISEAVEGFAEEHARQDEVSQLSGLVPLNSFLEAVEGDKEVAFVDFDGTEITNLHMRVMERMGQLRDLRENIAMEEGEAGPVVTKIDEELLMLKAQVPQGTDSMLDGSSVLFDVRRIEEGKGRMPRESGAEDIGPELEAEGLDVPVEEVGEDGVDIDLEELERRDDQRMRGLGSARQEPGGLARTSTWQAPQPDKEKRGDELNDPWFQEEERGSEIPARDSMIIEERDAYVEVGGIKITPLTSGEEKKIEMIGELMPEELREMARARIRHLSGTAYERDSWAENTHFIHQAKALEKEAEKRATKRARELWDAKKEGVGSATVVKKSGERGERSLPGMGSGRRTNPKGAETIVGREGAKIAKPKAGDAQSEESGLSRTGLFGDLDDTGIPDPTKEGSSAEVLGDLLDEGKPKKKERRMPTIDMKRGESRELSGLENTGTGLPKPKAGDAREEDQGRELTEEEMAATRLSTPTGSMTTAVTETLEDFSRYGDIYYALEKTFGEAGMKRSGLRELEEEIDEAITLIDELIEREGDTVYDGDPGNVSPEVRRKQRLKAFKNEFLVKRGESTENSLEKYRLWLEAKGAEYKKIEDVFDILEISPGEYSRKGVLRICDMHLETGALDDAQEKKVKRLKQMLEPEEGDDEFAAERNGELMHEMVVGLGTKRERMLRGKQVREIVRLEGQLRELKIRVNAFKAKEKQLVDILVKLQTSVKTSESKMEGMAKYLPEIKKALMELEPDYKERDKYMKALFSGIRGEGELGEMLDAKAREKMERKIRFAKKEAAEEALTEAAKQKIKSKRKDVTKGIAIAGLPVVGAAILAGGLWLGQHGVKLPLGNNSAGAEKEVAAEVQDAAAEGDTETSLPAGVAEMPDAGPLMEEEPAGPEPKESKGLEKEQEMDVQKTVPEEPAAEEEEQQVSYPRTPNGVQQALDDWCAQREAGIKKVQEEMEAKGEKRRVFVSTGMIRAAYRAIEPQLKGRTNPYDIGRWEKRLLKMKYPNKLVEAVIMTDLWTTDIPAEAKYAAGVRLSFLLGRRAGRPKYDFKKQWKEAKEAGIVLPELDEGTLLGDVESTGRAVARCGSASLMKSVVSKMENIKEQATRESKDEERKFMKKVRKYLGKRARRILKLWEHSVDEGKFESRRDVCRTATRGKSGSDAVERSVEVDTYWGKLAKKRSQKRRKAREEAEEITSDAISPEAEQTVSPPPKKKKKAKKSPCKGLEGTAYYECVHSRNQRPRKDNGEKRMHAPKNKGFGSVSKAKRHVRN